MQPMKPMKNPGAMTVADVAKHLQTMPQDEELHIIAMRPGAWFLTKESFVSRDEWIKETGTDTGACNVLVDVCQEIELRRAAKKKK